MKILVFNWQDIKNPFAGGAEVHLQEIFSRIAKKGHVVTLVCSQFRGSAPHDIIDGVRVFRVGTRNLFNFAVPLWYLFFGSRYDVVVDDVNKIPFFTPLYSRKPMVSIFHHLFGKSVYLETNPIAASYVYASEWLIPKIYRNVPVVAVSESTKSELIENGIPERNIQIIHNCVDHKLYRTNGKKVNNTFTIGFLGRIKKYKSIEHLLEAFEKIKNRIPRAKLLIVGDGDYLKTLKKIASNMKHANDITFTGYVSGDEKVRHIQQMDVVVNTSSKEGWGLTVIEANACGIPVIGADVPGLRDSIKNEETGLLYPYGDIDSLLVQLFRYYSDEELRNSLSQNSLRWAAKFDWDNAADAFLKVIEDSVYDWKYRKNPHLQ
jgi:glycosyltransferase involved in cell wall biosynthesis